MSQRNLIAAKLLSLTVEMTAAHARTEITWGFFHIEYRFTYVWFKYRHRNIKPFRIVLDKLPVLRTVSRIHYQELYFKRKLVVTLKLLKKLRHQHRVLATWDTHCNAVSLFYKLVLIYRFCKFWPYRLLKSLSYALFHLGCKIGIALFLTHPLHICHKPGYIPAFKTHNSYSMLMKRPGKLKACLSALAV